MARRVLIVSPHFPPVNAPDHQRVRMSLPYFEEFGWRATILTVRTEDLEGATLDPLLDRTVPAGTDIVRVGVLPARWTRRLSGLGGLAWRTWPFLWRAGCRILKKERFDVVYFSTTQFPLMSLGPRWKRRFGVPYVVDFQDPWLSDYYDRPGAPPPPGGRLRYGLANTLARALEPSVVREAGHIIAVSPAYVETFLQRYEQWLDPSQFTVLPFGAPENDFELLAGMNMSQTVFDANDGRRHWVYVGVIAPAMRRTLNLLFGALHDVREREPARWADVRLHFIGTSYAPPDRAEKSVEPIAQACGVGDLVEERTWRVPYFEALRLLLDSEVVMVIGSDDPGYSASKLYPCLLSRKPLLALLHENSPAVAILHEAGVKRIMTFHPERVADPEAIREAGEFLQEFLFSADTAALRPPTCPVFWPRVAHGRWRGDNAKCLIAWRLVDPNKISPRTPLLAFL